MTTCPLCLAGDMGKIWSKQLLMGTKSFQETSRHFNMMPMEILAHLNTHEFIYDEKTGECDSPDFFLRELLKVFRILKAWLEYVVTQPNVTAREIDLGLRLSKEVRETLKVLGDFQGRFERSNVNQLDSGQLNKKYLLLMDVILQGVCDECRPRLIEILDNTDQIIDQPMDKPNLMITSGTSEP